MKLKNFIYLVTVVLVIGILASGFEIEGAENAVSGFVTLQKSKLQAEPFVIVQDMKQTGKSDTQIVAVLKKRGLTNSEILEAYKEANYVFGGGPQSLRGGGPQSRTRGGGPQSGPLK